MQILNPAETFGDIIVDYSYVECSSACITALAAMQKQYPQHRRGEMNRALQRGKDYIVSRQQSDGSWCEAIKLFMATQDLRQRLCVYVPMLFAGTVHGAFASHMAHGLVLKHWLLWARTCIAVRYCPEGHIPWLDSLPLTVSCLPRSPS